MPAFLFIQMQQITKVSEITVSYTPQRGKKQRIMTSSEAHLILKEHYPDKTINLKEYFFVLYLDAACHPIGVYRLSEGGMTATVADVRILLAIALKVAAKNIIISHNHPSGNLEPSKEDINLTNKLKEACKFHDIGLLDHLILSQDSYFSFGDSEL